MSSARDEILARVRSALGREEIDRHTRERLDRRLADPPYHERPAVDADLVGAFESKLTAVQGGFRRAGHDGVMDAIGGCLEAHDVGRKLIAAPALESLAWPDDWHLRRLARRACP